MNTNHFVDIAHSISIILLAVAVGNLSKIHRTPSQPSLGRKVKGLNAQEAVKLMQKEQDQLNNIYPINNGKSQG